MNGNLSFAVNEKIKCFLILSNYRVIKAQEVTVLLLNLMNINRVIPAHKENVILDFSVPLTPVNEQRAFTFRSVFLAVSATRNTDLFTKLYPTNKQTNKQTNNQTNR